MLIGWGSVPTPVHVGTPGNGASRYSEFVSLCVTWNDRCCLVCVSLQSMYRKIVSKPAKKWTQPFGFLYNVSICFWFCGLGVVG